MRKILFYMVVGVLLLIGCCGIGGLLFRDSEPPKPSVVYAPAAPTARVAVEKMLQAATILEVYKIPNEYYSQSCQKPAHLTFYDWMNTLPMPPHEARGFDCSQTSAYVEWLSENCSHTATIAGTYFEDRGHLWVLIDIGGEPFAYEAHREAGKRWVPREGEGSTHFHYNPNSEWESIYYAPWANSIFEEEFAWWESYPELWEGG